MSATDSLSKSILTTLPEEKAQDLSEYLTYHGINPLLLRSEDTFSCIVAVDEKERDKCLKLYEDYKRCHETPVKKHGPIIRVVNEKLNDSLASSFLFLICGGIIFVVSFLRSTKLVAVENDIFGSSPVLVRIVVATELLLGAFFMFFGIRSILKARKARAEESRESQFTLKLITWFLGTYSPEDLDKQLTDEEDAIAPGDQRRNIIRRCICRQYEIDDEAYLTYLTEEIYASMYHTRKFNR